MSLFSDILSGISTVGQIAQNVSGLLGDQVIKDEASGVTIVGGFNLGAVHFVKTTINGQPALNAINRSQDRWVQVTTPDTVMTLSPGWTSATEILNLTNPADMPIETTVSSPPQNGSVEGGNKGSLFNFSIKNLKVGNVITINGFTIRCTTTQLLILPGIFMASYTILNNLDLKTIAGNGIRLITPMNPAPPQGIDYEGFNEDEPNVYNIGFEEYGINTKEFELNGVITLQSTTVGVGELQKSEKSDERNDSRKLYSYEQRYMDENNLWLS